MFEKPRSLIIDGASLLHVMRSKDSPIGPYAKMLSLIKICKAVVCCRMSPDQKREVVLMVKKDLKGTIF